MIGAYGMALTIVVLAHTCQSKIDPPRANEIILLDSRESGWEHWTKNTASE
uniref:Secreted protein n=1 Tax=Mesocestoides corti TaxID=53468 RepID=A0A5K3FPF0_MESCO